MTRTRVNSPLRSSRAPRLRRLLKRGWLKFAGVVGVLAAVVALIADGTTIYENITGTTDPPPHVPVQASTPQSPTAALSGQVTTHAGGPPSAEVHKSGTIPDMPDPKGFDFDSGQVLDQGDPLVEISGCGATSDLCVMSERSRIRVMAAPGAESKAACLEPPPADSEAFKGMYGLTTGSRICVSTNEGRIAMMILTRAPSVTDQTLNFRWITWN